MPVYHFTIHAYRSWRPDHPRGYTQRGKGYQKPDPDQARKYDERARQSPASFDLETQRQMIRIAYDFCQRRKMRLHAVGNEVGHVHFVLSWKGYSDWHEVMRRLKNILSTELNRYFQSPGKRWFVQHGSRKRVSNLSHLAHLKKTYLPGHPGIFWSEEFVLPS